MFMRESLINEAFDAHEIIPLPTHASISDGMLQITKPEHLVSTNDETIIYYDKDRRHRKRQAPALHQHTFGFASF
jgi:hypothetical protein